MAAEADVSEDIAGTHIYDGLCLGFNVPPTVLDAVKDVHFYPEDMLIITYPKSGTTWVQEMTWLIKHDANIEKSYKDDQVDRVPFLEFHHPSQEQPYILTMPKVAPRLIKSHLPVRYLENQLIDGNSKVIIVRRDLKDTLVSYFYHYKLSSIQYEGTWDMFFELFKNKKLHYGEWGEFHKGWQKYKDNPNFLFLQYEAMKLDPHGAVRMIAEHFDKPLTDTQVDTVVQYTGFDQMKSNPKISQPHFENFFRKGVVGDWQNHFSTDQISYIEQYEKELNLIEFSPNLF